MRSSLRSIFKILIFTSVFFQLSGLAFAVETLSNTGLVPGNVWFSKDPFYSGDKVRIYTVIFDGSEKDLRGDINFLDGNSLLCTNSFLVLAGRPTEAWCDWTVSLGDHSININIARVKASLPGEPEIDVILSNSIVGSSKKFVASRPIVTNNSILQSNSTVSVVDQSVPTAQDNILTSAINNIKSAVFGDPTGIAPPKNSKATIAPKSSQAKKQLADKTLGDLKIRVAKAVSGNPVLNNVASLYNDTNDKVAVPLNAWMESLYENFAKNTTNRPLLYFVDFMHLLFKYIILTPYFLTVVILYGCYIFMRKFYRRYFGEE